MALSGHGVALGNANSFRLAVKLGTLNWKYRKSEMALIGRRVRNGITNSFRLVEVVESAAGSWSKVGRRQPVQIHAMMTNSGPKRAWQILSNWKEPYRRFALHWFLSKAQCSRKGKERRRWRGGRGEEKEDHNEGEDGEENVMMMTNTKGTALHTIGISLLLSFGFYEIMLL